MKNMITLLLLFAMVSLESCNLFKNDPEPETEIEKLPPITQEGKNTFGCLVNGKALVVRNTYDQVAIYQGGLLQIGGGVEEGNYEENISIRISDSSLEARLYDLNNFPDNRARFYRQIDNNNTKCYYEFEDTFDGLVQLLKVDKTKYVVSGTFKFSTVTQECDTIRITDGRFDMQYIP